MEAETDLHRAAKIGDATRVEELVNEGADLDAQDHFGRTPLQMAANIEASKCIEILLYAGADASICSIRGETALTLALQSNSEGALMLIDFMSSEDINVRTVYNGCTALMMAARLDNQELLQKLITAGADLHIQDFKLNFAVDYTADENCADLLLNKMNHEYIDKLERRSRCYHYQPVSVAKRICEKFPEMFAANALEYLLQHWYEDKDGCVHIIQILLSQLTLNNEKQVFSNGLQRFWSRNLLEDLIELLDTLMYYGQDVVVDFFYKNCETLPNALSLYIDAKNWPTPTELYAMACLSPRNIPLSIITHTVKGKINTPLPFFLEGTLNEVHSIQHMCRVTLRKKLLEIGLVSYKDFTNALQVMGMPKPLQYYIRYLDSFDLYKKHQDSCLSF